MAQWYLLRSGQEQGPVTDQQLRDLAAKGRILPTEKVRRADMDKPILAAVVPNLFPKIAVAKSQPLPPPVAAQPILNKEPKTNPFISLLLAIVLIAAGAGAFYYTYRWDCERRIGKALAAGEQLWQAGDKEKAVVEYQKVAHILPEGDTKAVVMSRIAEVNPPPSPPPVPSTKPEAAEAEDSAKVAAKSSDQPSADEVVLVETPIAFLDAHVSWGEFALSPDGRFLIADNSEVWNIESHKRLTCMQDIHSPSFSPTGDRVAALWYNSKNRRLHLAILFLLPTMLHLVEDITLSNTGLNDLQHCTAPLWSDDGKKLVINGRSAVWRPEYAKNPRNEVRHGFVVDFTKRPASAIELVTFDRSFYNSVTPRPRFISGNTQIALDITEGRENGRPFEETQERDLVFDVATGNFVKSEPPAHYRRPPWELHIVPFDDGRVEVHRTADERLMYVVGKPDGANRCLHGVSCNGRFVATASSFQTNGIEVWDTSIGTTVTLAEYKQRLTREARPNYLQVKAPPVSDALYQRIGVGMRLAEVTKLLGGRGYKETGDVHVENKTDWISESVELYHSKEHPGSSIMLHYRGEHATTDPTLIEKAMTGGVRK